MQRTLKEWRHHCGFSQNEMAMKLNISPSTYNIWENNPEEIRPRNALIIARVLGVSIEEIIFFNKNSNLKYVINVEN